MSRNGNGTYNLPAGNPVVSGTTISSTWANTTLNDIAGALTGSVASDGQTPMSASLNMATNKVVNVGDPTSAQDAATKAYVDASIPSTANFLEKTNNLSDVSSTTTARTNLSAAKSGANSDITSLTGLTTALSASQGGTGLTAPGTSGNVLTSNGTAWTSATPPTSLPGLLGQVFTSSGTFTIPTGVTAIKVTVVGGGGGGGGDSGCSPVIGSSGGTSSVASGTQTITTISATGGSYNGNGGTGSGGDLNIGGSCSNAQSGGSSILGGGSIYNSGNGRLYGGGGSASSRTDVGGGAGGGAAIKYLTGLTPGNTLSVTRGAGGAGAGGGGTGANGVIIFEW